MSSAPALNDSGGVRVALCYRLTQNTEIGLFHYRYHDRVPALFFDFDILLMPA